VAKLFAITIIVIAIVSAIPIVRHTWWMAPDISTHGAPIDEQTSETMAEAGISFVASQIILALFTWRFSGARVGEKIKDLPGGAKAMVWAAFLLVGTEVLALGVFGVKAWATVYLTPPAANATGMIAAEEDRANSRATEKRVSFRRRDIMFSPHMRARRRFIAFCKRIGMGKSRNLIR